MPRVLRAAASYRGGVRSRAIWERVRRGRRGRGGGGGGAATGAAGAFPLPFPLPFLEVLVVGAGAAADEEATPVNWSAGSSAG